MKRTLTSIFGMAGLVAMLALPLAPSANADIVVFDFANNGPLDGEAAGGIQSAMGATDTVVLETLSISAPNFNDPSPLTNLSTVDNETNIASNNGSGGLGINNDSISNPDFSTESIAVTSTESGNINFLESVTFDFDTTVVFTSIDFASLGGTEEFLRINVAGNSTNFDFFDGNTGDIFADPLNGLVIPAGTDITFTGLGALNETNLRVDQFTVETIANVPEPSSLALLGFGSVLMVARRRRRK